MIHYRRRCCSPRALRSPRQWPRRYSEQMQTLSRRAILQQSVAASRILIVLEPG